MSTFSISYNITGTNSLTPILKNISSDFERLQKKMEVPFQKFEKLASAGISGMLKITAPLTLGIGMALKQFGDMEQLTTQMQVSFGNISQQMMKAGIDFAKSTALSNAQVFGLMTNLKNSVGMMDKDIMPFIKDYTTTIYGLGVGKNFDSITEQIKQGLGKGELELMDIKIIESWGLPIKKMLADTLGVSVADVMAKVSEKGGIGITNEMVYQMFKKYATDPRYANSLQKYTKSFFGAMDLMQGSLSQLGASFGKKISEAFKIPQDLVSISKFIDKITESIDKMSPANFKLIASMVGLGIVIPPLLLTIGVLGKAYTTMRFGLGLLVSAQTRVFGGMGLLNARMAQMPSLFAMTKNGIISLANGFTRFGAILLRIPQIIAGVIPFVITSIRQPMFALGLLRTQVAGLGVVLRTMFTTVGGILTRFLAPLFILQAVFVSLRGLVKGFTGDSNVGIGKLLSGIGKLLSGIMEVGKFINNIIKISLTGIEFVFVKIGQMLAYSMNLLAKIPGLGFLKQEENKEVGGGFIGAMKNANSFLETVNQEARYQTKLDKMPEPKQNAEIKSDVKVVIESPTPVKVKTVENETSYSRGNFSIIGANKSNQYILGQ